MTAIQLLITFKKIVSITKITLVQKPYLIHCCCAQRIIICCRVVVQFKFWYPTSILPPLSSFWTHHYLTNVMALVMKRLISPGKLKHERFEIFFVNCRISNAQFWQHVYKFNRLGILHLVRRLKRQKINQTITITWPL